MCDTCGCNVTPANRHLVEEGGKLEHTADGHHSVEVLQSLLAENDHQAAHNRHDYTEDFGKCRYFFFGKSHILIKHIGNHTKHNIGGSIQTYEQ